MEKLFIEKKSNTPFVEFDPEAGIMKIEGRSIPENPGDFYDDLLDWLEEYFSKPCTLTTINLNLEYINSGSSKYLLGLFRIIKDNYDAGNNLVVNWYYEEDDESIQTLGEHYRNSLNVPFNLIEYI